MPQYVLRLCRHCPCEHTALCHQGLGLPLPNLCLKSLSRPYSLLQWPATSCGQLSIVVGIKSSGRLWAVCMVCSMGARPEYSLSTNCSNINCPQNFPNRVWKVYNEQGIKNSSCELLAIGKKRAPSKRNQFTGTEEKSCWGLCTQGTENWYSKVDYQNGGL